MSGSRIESSMRTTWRCHHLHMPSDDHLPSKYCRGHRRQDSASMKEVSVFGIFSPFALRLSALASLVFFEELDAAVAEFVQQLLPCGPKTLAAQKRLVHQWMDSTMSRSFELGIDAFRQTYRSEEPTEGMKAFGEKRRPNWAME
jgi:enoyl-CoA hydratase/carnithine racemase